MNLKRFNGKYSALSVMKLDGANSSLPFEKTSYSVSFKSNPHVYVKVAINKQPFLKKNYLREKVIPIIENTKELSGKIKLERSIITGSFIIIGQVWNKLIIAIDCYKGIILAFDQHAVHERVRYEYFISKLLNQINSDPTETHFKKFDPKIIEYKKSNVETLLVPKKIPRGNNTWLFLSNSLLSKISTLSNFGFNYEITNEKNDQSTKIECSITLPSVSLYLGMTSPSILGEHLQIDILPSLLSDIKNEIKPIVDKLPKPINHLLMSKSCKNAIKFNDVLDDLSALNLISQLKHCNHPFYCIHGRNSVYPLCDYKSATKMVEINLRNSKKINLKKLVSKFVE